MSNRKYFITDFIQSLLIYLALFADMSLIYPNIYAQANVNNSTTVTIVTFFQRLDALWGSFSFQKDCCLIFIIISLFLLRKYTTFLENAKKFFISVPSAIFSSLYLFGHSFYHTNSADYLFGDSFVFVISVFRGFGLFYLLRLLLSLCHHGLSLLAAEKTHTFRHKITYCKLLSALLIAWIPQLFVIYPGGYCNDVQDQLLQFFGYTQMADPHPPLFTMIIGSCVWIGNKLSHPNWGLFLYIILQYLFMASGLAYCLFYFHKKLQNKWFLLFGLCFFSLLPNFSHYASVVIKNAPYAVCLVVMSVCAIEIMEGYKKAAFLYSVTSILGSLICHNGIYITIPMSLALTIYILKNIPGKRQKASFICITLISILCFYVVTDIVYPAMNIKKEKDHLLYTNQLQHTSRLLLTHPEEFTDEDLEVISRVIDIDQISEYYNPVTSDGIKPIVDLLASSEDVAAYRQIWNRQIRKHPLLILEASFNVSYGFWAPVARNEENDFSMYFYESDFSEIDFHVPTKLHGLRHIYEELLENYVSLPVIRLLQNPGFYFWIFVFILSVLFSMKKKRYLICMIPGMMTSLFYVGIPAYFHHPRYAFPLIYSTVMYLGLILLSMREKEEGKKQKKESESL